MSRPRPTAMIRGGYTLVELLVALIGAGALTVGLLSTIFIALRATDTSDTPIVATIEGAAVLADMLSEIEFAHSFSEITPNAITFTVPDRNGDSSCETIRYAWSGSPGGALTRQYNGGTVVTLVENVYVFQHDLPSPPLNRLSNPGIESGTTAWQAMSGSNILSLSSPVHSGSGVLQALRNTGTDNAGLRQDVTAQLTNGTIYDVSTWVTKQDPQGPCDAQLQLRITSSGGGERLFQVDPVVLTPSNWLRIRGTVTPVWSGSLVSAYFEVAGVSNIKDLYIDDAVLSVKTTFRQYVTIRLQVGTDSQSLLHSGKRLINSPL